jgi:HPt (histidine-containing phosphotransfer) domain-containing protein
VVAVTDKVIVGAYALDQYIDLMGEEGKEFIVEIIDAFLVDAPNNFDLLVKSLVENDFTSFQRAAHTLKTNCSSVGAIQLADRFLELERCGSERDLSCVDHILKVCNFKFQQLRDELKHKKISLMRSDANC